MGPDVIIPIAGMLTGSIVVWTIGSTVKHWVNRYFDHQRSVGAGEEGGHMAQLEDRLTLLEDQVASRMMELEERMDFTERVLTRGADAPEREGS